MASLDTDLKLHLALDEVQGGLLPDGAQGGITPDESANDNDGRVKGDPRLLPDELFGSCLDFDGGDDYVEVKDPFVGAKDFTISVWVKPAAGLVKPAADAGKPAAADKSPQTNGIMGLPGSGPRKPSLSLVQLRGGLLYDSSDTAQKQFSGQLDDFFTPAGGWVHVAWVKQGAQYSFYRGGELFASREAPAEFFSEEAGGYLVGRVDDFWKGQLAHARVYGRALTADEIAALMLDDQTANAAFRRAHPVEFRVYDEDQQPVIRIDDGGNGRPLYVEIANSSQRSMELAQPASTTPSPDNFHFALRFRPGALSAPSLQRLGPAAERLGWSLYREPPQPDGTVSLYFLNPSPTARVARPGESIVLTLPGVAADAGGGSRGTRVELRYSQLRYTGETAQIGGSRVQHLEIVSERGKRNTPLHVGFLGSNRVLNDRATVNELRLRITNVLSEGDIPLAPSTANPHTTFHLSFDAQGEGEQRDWALGTSEDLKDVDFVAVKTVGGQEVNDASWVVKKNVEGKSPVWELTTPDKTSLAPGEMVQLRMTSVKSSLPSGQANLYVAYQNLPGYWDGQFVVSAEKSPVVTVGQNVGIGINPPRSALDTGLGLLSGAAADYPRAQATLSGGGKVTWSRVTVSPGPGQTVEGGALKWSRRFVAISMGGLRQSFHDGYVNITQPDKDIPAANVWDGKPRKVNADGVQLFDWEALYAVHRVGGRAEEVEFRVALYTSPFDAPGNWLLVAVRNADDRTVKLGNGVTLALNSSSTNGSHVMTGTIVMWSGDEKNIPDGWVLCDGRKPVDGLVIPDLTGRFVLGAGQSAQPNPPKTYPAGAKGGQERVTLDAKEMPVHRHDAGTQPAGAHSHGIRFDSGGKGDLGSGQWAKSSLQDAYANFRVWTDGVDNHTHNVSVGNAGGGASHDNMPPYWALCYIIKL